MDIDTNRRKHLVGNARSHFLKMGYSVQDKMKKFGKCVPPSDVEARLAVGRGDPRCFHHLCRCGSTMVGAASMVTEDYGPAKGGRGPRKEATDHQAVCLEWRLSQGENMGKLAPLWLLHQMRNHREQSSPLGLPWARLSAGCPVS